MPILEFDMKYYVSDCTNCKFLLQQRSFLKIKKVAQYFKHQKAYEYQLKSLRNRFINNAYREVKLGQGCCIRFPVILQTHIHSKVLIIIHNNARQNQLRYFKTIRKEY